MDVVRGDVGRLTHGIDRQSTVEDGVARATVPESTVPPDGHQGSSIGDILFELPLVLRDGELRVGMAEILKNHDVEGAQFRVENLLHRKRDEGELTLRVARLGVIAARPQNVEGNQVHVRVLAKEASQEAFVPRGAPHHQENAYPVPNHLQDKTAAVVLSDGLPRKDGSAQGVHETPGLVGRKRERNRRGLVRARHMHGLRRKHLPLSVQHHGYVAAGKASHPKLHLQSHRVADKGKVIHFEVF
jgi:hypothetical protein